MMLKSLNLKTTFYTEDAGNAPVPGWMKGIASTSSLDRGGDVVAPGAFSASIADRGFEGVRGVKMLWQHDSDKPAGRWTKMEQLNDGLHVEGYINLDHEVGQRAYAHVRAGEVAGLSVGFRTKRREYNEETDVRTVLEADLWEVSLVTFPMNEDARITAVKSFPFRIETGDDIAEVAKKFAATYEISRRQADLCLDALKAAMRADPELIALKAALGCATHSVQRTDAQPLPEQQALTPAIQAFGKILENLKANRL